MIAVVAVVVLGATGAFFSDTETSTGNTFTAGDIDLKIDNESYVTNNEGVLVASPGTSWDMADLIAGTHKFFDFSDLKPGDVGEDTISIHVGSNDAWMCAAARITDDSDQTCTEPELADDPSCVATDTDGELDDEVNFAFWNDDGDNVYEQGENIFLQGPLSDIGAAGQITLADSQSSILGATAPIPGGTTFYIGKAWCFGTLTPNPQTTGDLNPLDNTGFTCDGSGVNNASQTDQAQGDLQFYATQSRNNGTFTCSQYDPTWPEGQTQGPFVGAALGDYTQPEDQACDVTVDDSGGANFTTIQAGVDAAGTDSTVCVADGTYNENVDITDNNLTLAGDGATATSTINGRVRVDATGVTVQGFKILGAVVSSEGGANGVYVTGGSNSVTISDNVIDGASQADAQERGIHFEVGGTTSATVMNNVIENWGNTGIYINPTAGPVSITYNDFLANNVAIGSSSPNGLTITNNDFVGNIAEAIGMDDTGGAISGIEIHINNFTPAGAGNNVNSYGVTPMDATNNWWDSEAAGDRTNDTPDIDVTSPAGSAFAQN